MASSQPHSWSRLQNENILWCYYQSRTPEAHGYRARMHLLWCNLYPDIPFNEQRVADQVLSLLRRKVFTDLELENIHRECFIGPAGVTTEESEPVVPSVQVDINHQLMEGNTDHQLVEETLAAYTADLSTHELALKDKIESTYKADHIRIRLPRLVWNKRLQNLLHEANRAVSCIETSNLIITFICSCSCHHRSTGV